MICGDHSLLTTNPIPLILLFSSSVQENCVSILLGRVQPHLSAFRTLHECEILLIFYRRWSMSSFNSDLELQMHIKKSNPFRRGGLVQPELLNSPSPFGCRLAAGGRSKGRRILKPMAFRTLRKSC